MSPMIDVLCIAIALSLILVILVMATSLPSKKVGPIEFSLLGGAMMSYAYGAFVAFPEIIRELVQSGAFVGISSDIRLEQAAPALIILFGYLAMASIATAIGYLVCSRRGIRLQ